MVVAKKAQSCSELLKQYEKTGKVIKTAKLTFLGVDGYDVYNITGEFKQKGETYIAGRVEKRDSEISCVRFFRKTGDYEYSLFSDVSMVRVQDPFVSQIDGELVVGGTQIDLDPIGERRIVNWRTVFFKGKDIESLRYWFTGPCRMKDVRIFDYDDTRMLILTRPQGGKAGMGKIGMVFADKGEIPSESMLASAELFDTHFIDGEWGGANEIFRLKNGKLGVLGHIAYLEKQGDDHIRHYHSMVFELDAENRACSPVKIIARRADFASGPYKRKDIADVLFSGGLVRGEDGTAKLFTGVSDCEGHVAVIKDPFQEYEEE